MMTDFVAIVRAFEADHGPGGWPAVDMATLSGLADEIERQRTVIAKVNAKCDHLGIRLGEAINDRDCEKRMRKDSDDMATELREAVRALAAVNAWLNFGECRSRGADPILSPADADALARKVLGPRRLS